MSTLALQVRAVLLRELRAVQREIDTYGNESLLWHCPARIPNSAGTLALHVAGSVKHFVGARLGTSGWIRDRPREFEARGVPPDVLAAELAEAAAAVDQVLPALAEADMATAFSEIIMGQGLAVGDVLLHQCTHVAYHLGQMDYHRRLVTGQTHGVGTLPLAELLSARPGAGGQ